MTESIRTKLIRIMNLAERGSAGERQAASNLLQKLMEKYGVTPDDLQSEDKHDYRFDVPSDALVRKLFVQVAATVLDVSSLTYQTSRASKSAVYLTCTPSQYVEIRNQFDFFLREYRSQLREMKKKFLSAFVQANDIYPPSDCQTPAAGRRQLSEEELDRLREILEMSHRIKRSNYYHQLESCQTSR